MDNKVYTPEIIPDQPLPGQTGPVSMVVQQPGSINSSFSPATIDDTLLPTKKIATELLSVSLNTRSKKILQEFQFTQMGAIQIGRYTEGVNGDIRITQGGIVARNLLGDTTISIDGDTGDAFFAGTLQAGTLISGAVAVGNGDIIIDGATKRMIFYNGLLPSIVIGNV